MIRRAAWLPFLLLVLLAGCAGRPEANGTDGEEPASGGESAILATVSALGQRYVAVRSGDDEIDVNPAQGNGFRTAEQLRGYARSMKDALGSIRRRDSLPVTITMKQALPLEDFETFAGKYGIEVDGYQLRQLDELQAGGYERLTLMASPKQGRLVPGGLLELRDSPHFIGVTAIYGTLSGHAYDKIIRDERVFAADITGQLLKEELLKNKRILDAVSGEDVRIDVNVPNLYWELEDTGIVRYDGIGKLAGSLP